MSAPSSQVASIAVEHHDPVGNQAGEQPKAKRTNLNIWTKEDLQKYEQKMHNPKHLRYERGGPQNSE